MRVRVRVAIVEVGTMSDERHAVLVTGSRNWVRAWVIEFVLIDSPVGSTLIVGDCKTGVDLIARKTGRAMGLVVVKALADWRHFGRGAGPRRNARMVELLCGLRSRGFVCRCEAFPLSVSTGTRGCIALVRERGITVREWNERGIEVKA